MDERAYRGWWRENPGDPGLKSRRMQMQRFLIVMCIIVALIMAAFKPSRGASIGYGACPATTTRRQSKAAGATRRSSPNATDLANIGGRDAV
jgi:hypothetical protein